MTEVASSGVIVSSIAGRCRSQSIKNHKQIAETFRNSHKLMDSSIFRNHGGII
jgi:hypothetical protein